MNYNALDNKKKRSALSSRIVEKSMLGKAWVLADDVDNVNSDDLVKKILAGRGIRSDAEIKKFLNPSIK